MKKVAASKLRKIARASREVGASDVEHLALFALGEVTTTQGLSKQASSNLIAGMKLKMLDGIAKYTLKLARLPNGISEGPDVKKIKDFITREKLAGRIYHSIHKKAYDKMEAPTNWVEKQIKKFLMSMSSASDLLRACASLVSARSIEDLSESIGVSTLALKKHLDPNLETKSKVKKYTPAVIEHAIDSFARIKDAQIFGVTIAITLLGGLILGSIYGHFTGAALSVILIGASVPFGKFLAFIVVGLILTSHKSVASFLRKAGVALGLIPLAILNDLVSFIGWSKEKIAKIMQAISGRLAEAKASLTDAMANRADGQLQ
jgi:hypothetical protein